MTRVSLRVATDATTDLCEQSLVQEGAVTMNYNFNIFNCITLYCFDIAYYKYLVGRDV